MSNYISILPEILLAVTLVSAFGILFLTILKIVRQTELFQGRTAMFFSLLISASAITGCAQLLVMPNNIVGVEPERNIALNYSLLPAIIPTGLIVILGLFAFVITTAPSNKDEIPAKKPAHSSMKPPKSPRRPREEKSATKESKESPKPAGSAL
jgi:hypothetical protein